MTERLCLMQVHAHPDDEASKGAGVAAMYAAEGARTVLVCCTGGEAGDILNPKADTPEARADPKAVRMRELDASAQALGYGSVHLLGYRDSGMPDSEFNKHPEAFANAEFDEAVGRLVKIIRAERPHVLITYGDDQSAYPHPDHIRCHDISVVAFDAAAAEGRYPEAGEPWQPLKLYYVGFTMRWLRAMHDELVALGRDPGFYADRLKDVGEWSDHRFMTRIDVSDFIGARSAALLAHATQIDPDSFWFALSDDERRKAYPYEDFILARSYVENGVADDEFEHDLFAGLR
jgi:mycothiol S-conjugate amidase